MHRSITRNASRMTNARRDAEVVHPSNPERRASPSRGPTPQPRSEAAPAQAAPPPAKSTSPRHRLDASNAATVTPPPDTAAGPLARWLCAQFMGRADRGAARSRRRPTRSSALDRQGLSRVRRRSGRRCASARIQSAGRSLCRSRRGGAGQRAASKKKNSSNPGFRASHPVGRPSGAQLSEVRPPGVRLGGLDASHRGGRDRRDALPWPASRRAARRTASAGFFAG